jgi:hypothetical protein
LFKRLEVQDRIERAEQRDKRVTLTVIYDRLGITDRNARPVINYMRNIGKRLQVETNTVEELLEEYLTWQPNVMRQGEVKRIGGFFYYLRDNRPSQKDMVVMIVFEEVAKKFDPSVQVDCRVFKGRGEALYDRLVTWMEGAGNSIEEVLVDYFKGCITQSQNFNKTLVHTPKSFMENFGWKCWIEAMEEFGGKQQYLLPSKVEHAFNEQVRSDLDLIADLKAKALKDGDIELYDDLNEAGFDLEAVEEVMRKYDVGD